MNVRESPLTKLQDEILEGVGHHRYLATSQARRLFLPSATVESGATNKILRRLEARGLVESTRLASRGDSLWWLTAEGYALLGRRQARPYRASREKAEGQNQAHSIAVTEVGVIFAEASRLRGDECGPFALEHEVRLSSGPSPVIADGLLGYTEVRDEECIAREALIELDRARYPVRRLWERLRAYASLWADPAGWAVSFPGGWPPTLVVVDAPTPLASELRIAQALGHLEGDPELAGLGMPIGFATMAALRQSGPWAPVWSIAGDPTGRDWTLAPDSA